MAYLFDHPLYLVALIAGVLLFCLRRIMPVMDGIEATKKIRNSVREDNDVPIFAMTANTFATDRKRCADAGIFRNR